MDLIHLAKYPFTEDAKKHVLSLNMSFEDMLNHPIYSDVTNWGVDRVKQCIEGRFNPKPQDELSCNFTILSYPIARMIAYGLGQSLKMKYASGEAKAAYAFLKQEDKETLEKISNEVGIKFKDGKMHFTEFVVLSSQLKKDNLKWRLTNRTLSKGYVFVESDEIPSLIQESIMTKVHAPIDKKAIPEKLRVLSKDLRVSLSEEREILDIKEIDERALPPCINHILGALENGIASHNGMFILATFLSNLGLQKEGIHGVFERFPKYEYGKADYQLSVITGEKGGTEYTCPTCQTIKSQGLCKAECKVKHPLQYYRRNSKTIKVIKKKSK